MSIPAQRPPPPALPIAIGILGAGGAIVPLALTFLRFDAAGWLHGENRRLWTLFTLAGSALALGGTIVAAAGALSLVRARRSPGAALTAAAFALGVVSLCVQLVAVWLWPWGEMARGWRHEAYVICDWANAAVPVLATAGLCAAGWTDRGVRLITPGAIGAALLAAPPPILLERAYQWVEFGAWKWDPILGDYRLVPDGRLWIVPTFLAIGRLAWAGATAVLVLRQQPVPVDTVAPRPPAPALRRFAVSLLVMAAVAVVAGIAIAIVQGKPAQGTSPLELVIPSAVALAAAGVAAALIDVAVTDVVPVAARRAGVAAICVLWCVAVIVAQTIGSQRSLPTGGGLNPLLFTIFEPPWMPGMVGAAVAVVALLNITVVLSACAQQAGLRPSRAQSVIIVLALAIGALTAPWVLGFGTRRLPLDELRVATLASAALVNLAAWIALARSAWRTAAALDEPGMASVP